MSKYKEEDLRNHLRLYNKWVFRPEKTLEEFVGMKGVPNVLDFSNHKPKVAIWTGPAWEPWTYENVQAGMAGSETWAGELARALLAKGYEVTIYGDTRSQTEYHDCPDGVQGYVRYVDHNQMLEDLQYRWYDAFIISRNVEPLKLSLHTSKAFVMVHDIWLSQNPDVDLQSWKVAGYAYLSDWHKEFILGHHKKMPPEKMFLTANGVRTDLYHDVPKRNQMVFSSSPDRGLYQLLGMLPEIRKAVPDFTVHVTYGTLNWESACKARNDQAGLAFIAKIKEAMKQPGVVDHGRVDKETLARLQAESNVWLYPTWFTETFCIGAIENSLAGNAILTSDLAGLKRTAVHGIRLPADGLTRDGDYPKEYVDAFIRESISLLTDQNKRQDIATRCRDNAQQYTWDKIADEWINKFNQG